MLPVVLHMFKLPELNTSNCRDLHRIDAFETVLASHEVLYESRAVLNDEQFQRLERHADELLLRYNVLTKYNLDRGNLCYNFTFQFHMWCHVTALAIFEPQIHMMRFVRGFRS